MKWGVLICFCFLLMACSHEPLVKNTPKLFLTLPSNSTGITFSNDLKETDSLNILDYLYFYNGGGTAVGDINNDGLPDIYFSGNQKENKLYLNNGDLTFKDITHTSGTQGNNSWSTGSIMFDANADGLLDIYVRAVVGINNFQGHDELFINNGDNTFTERSQQYGLDFKNYGTTAAVLDYDKDGDLDIYLLNHAVHTEASFGSADLRLQRNDKTGDKLLRNDGTTFTDVSTEMGIFGGINGYGLGISIADFNQDGWPDIYIGNDFHEDDYYYINEGGLRFRESLKEYFPHTSRFSMGNDVSDLNHDGFPDLVSLDMLPEDEKVLKASEGDDNIQTQKLRTDRFGYHYQFTRNMLFINQPEYQFEERALSSNIAATDWSWSPLFADFDQDGRQDLFISNGIPKRPNNLDFINFTSSGKIQNSLNKSRLLDNEALKLMPNGAAHNYIFKGNDNLSFTDKSALWIEKKLSVSGASALADLDNDGDLDIVVNNINEEASIYINQTDTTSTSLKLIFKFSKKNAVGIGTKVFAYKNGKLQYKELYTSRGFQASSEPQIHFGFGKQDHVDSLKIIWPDNNYQMLYDIATNQTLSISPQNTTAFDYKTLHIKSDHLFSKKAGNLGIAYVHKEDSYIDFNRQKLIPYQISDRGPATTVGDVNGDGIEDIYIGSSKFLPSALYLGGTTGFESTNTESLQFLAKTEDKTATIINKNIIVGTAGGDFSTTNSASEDYTLQFSDSLLITTTGIRGNTSIIIKSDYDADGDMDIFIGHHAITGDYGKAPESFLLKNVNGTFIKDEANELGAIGMVTDAVWTDFNEDGTEDLIVIGEWMQPLFYANFDGILKKVSLLNTALNGLWQSIEPFDIDHDGDMDYLLGNWGTNSKFKATQEYPMNMYYSDFDNNGQTETIVTTEKNGNYYPIHNLQELATQLIFLKKKYASNNDFAGQTAVQIFGEAILKSSIKHTVNTLSSGYLKKDKGTFTFVPFEDALQVSPIMDFVVHDFNGDDQKDALAAGNYFGTKPYHGRLDSFSGALIESDKKITLGHKIGLDFSQKSVRHLNIITINNISYLLVTFNNDAAQVYNLQISD